MRHAATLSRRARYAAPCSRYHPTTTTHNGASPMLPHPRHRAPRRHYALAVFELVCIVLAWTGFALVACALFLPGR